MADIEIVDNEGMKMVKVNLSGDTIHRVSAYTHDFAEDIGETHLITL